MKKAKKLVVLLVLMFTFFIGGNVQANITYIDDETPKMEQYEKEYTNENMPKLQARSGGGLTIPKEGVYDEIKDTKNSSGVMTERRFYNKGKLVEKRTYTQQGSTDCRMRNKYLYFSDGKTIERHRTYSNKGKTCYNLETKVYNSKSKIQSHTFYEGKVDGYITEVRTYNESGTYYVGKSFYKKGIVDRKEYWIGEKPNRITHIANFNSAGTNWTDATYYNSENNKTSYVKYAGTEPNKKIYTIKYDKETQEKTTSIYYDETGEYIDYKTKWQDSKKVERTYYNKNKDGKINLIRYYDNLGVDIFTDIKYENGVILYEKTYNNDRSYYIDFYDGSKKDERIIYNAENIEIFSFQYDELGENLFADTIELNLSEEDVEKLESLEYKIIVDFTKGTYIIEQKNEDDLEEDQVYDAEMEIIDELEDDEEYISEEEPSFINSDTTEEDVDELIDENPEFAEEIIDEYLVKTFEDELIKEEVTENDYEKINQLMSQLTPEEIDIINEAVENNVSDEEGTEILVNILKEKEMSSDPQEAQARFIFPVVRLLAQHGPKIWKGVQTVGKVAKNYGTKAINWVGKQFNGKKAVNNNYTKYKSNPKTKYTKRTTKAKNTNKSTKQKYKNNKKQKQKSVVTNSTPSKLPNESKEMYDKYEKAGWNGNLPGQTKGTTAGREWKNKNNQLPRKGKNKKTITYKYFDVNNKIPGQKKDGKRFVKGSNGSIYYTKDHYKTFKKLK